MWNLVSTGFVVPVPKFQMYLFMTNVIPATVYVQECMDEYMCAYKHKHTQTHPHTHTHTHTHTKQF